MRFKPLIGGVAVVASLTLMGISVSPPTPSHADVSIVVSAAEDCVWYMTNLPAVINMSSATKYKGDPLTVRATISPAIGFSGDPEVPGYSAACSFYNSSFTTKKLSMAIDSGEFVAKYGAIRDDSLSFGLDQRPLSVQVSNVEQSCQSVTGMPLTVPSSFGWGRGKSNVSAAAELVAFSDVPDYGEKNFFASGTSANCAPELEIGVEISSSATGPPAGAGLTYVFTGPSVTFTMGNVSNTYASVGVQAASAFRNIAPKPNLNRTSKTLTSTQQRYGFSTDSSQRIYAGSLYGTAAEFRFVPTRATWDFYRSFWTNSPRKAYGFNISYAFDRHGTLSRPFTTRVTVNYQIDYRYPGEDWVVNVANQSLTSNDYVDKVPAR